MTGSPLVTNAEVFILQGIVMWDDEYFDDVYYFCDYILYDVWDWDCEDLNWGELSYSGAYWMILE